MKVYFAVPVVLLLFTTGCIPTRQLAPDENYFYKQDIKGVESDRAEDLSNFYRQTPNRRFPLIPAVPYVYFYNWGKRIYDKKYPSESYRDSVLQEEKKAIQKKFDKKISQYDAEESLRARKKRQRLIEKKNDKLEKVEARKEGNWLMRAVGEPPSIFDPKKAAQASEQMEIYLRQSGYFAAEVDTSFRQKGRRIYLTYEVKLKRPHRYRKIKYRIADSTLKGIVLRDSVNRRFKRGDRYDENELTRERGRLFDLLRNNGYFAFSKQYIFFEMDTLAQVPEYRIDATLVIQGKHTQYRLDSVRFIADQQRGGKEAQTTRYEGIWFREHTKRYSKKVLSHRIHLGRDSLYRHENSVATQRSLASLDLFKFVNIRYDTTGNRLVSNINVNSYPKYNISLEAGVNVTQQSVPGPFVTLGFQNRNVFRGCELLTIQLRGLLEAQGNFGDLEETNLYAQEYNLSTDLIIPKFFFPFAGKLNRRYGKYNPKTRLRASYTQTNRVLYNRLNMQVALSYLWNNNRNSSFDIALLDFNAVLTPSLASSFRNYLDSLSAQGNPLQQSFQNSVLRSTSFSYTYNDNRYGNNPNNYFFRGQLEQGGTQIRRLLFNSPGLGDVMQRLINPDSLADYNYLRTDLDLRRNIRLSRHSQLALRTRLGLVYPFGPGATGSILPYEKYFFAGGGNSIRAWQPRRLGPGGFKPPFRERSNPFDYAFEQPGELLLEMNAEWRRDLFSVAEMALFLDAGNVWMINNDGREEAQFRWKNFWQQIAIGGGFGLRLDFSFFIIRGDVGIKLHDPAAQVGQNWLFRYFAFDRPLGRPGQAVFNLAIGYPF